MAEPTFFQVVRSQRGIRYYKADPVPDDVVDKVLQAAVWAPSGGNRQPWSFIVIRDRQIKRRLGELYREGSALSRGAQPATPAREGPPREGPLNFAQDMENVPVLIMVCMGKGGTQQRDTLKGGSIYPAVQNIMLAAAALGLGTRLTTIWHYKDAGVAEQLGVPDDAEAMALIPLGYPAEPDHLGGSKRTPAREVTFYERWGQTKPAG